MKVWLEASYLSFISWLSIFQRFLLDLFFMQRICSTTKQWPSTKYYRWTFLSIFNQSFHSFFHSTITEEVECYCLEDVRYRERSSSTAPPDVYRVGSIPPQMFMGLVESSSKPTGFFVKLLLFVLMDPRSFLAIIPCLHSPILFLPTFHRPH